MQTKTIAHNWGKEIILTESPSRIIRIYTRAKGGNLTLDMSQVRDRSWDKFLTTFKKYGQKAKLPETSLPAILNYFDPRIEEIVI
jgi:hypothetical protein